MMLPSVTTVRTLYDRAQAQMDPGKLQTIVAEMVAARRAWQQAVCMTDTEAALVGHDVLADLCHDIQEVERLCAQTQHLALCRVSLPGEA